MKKFFVSYFFFLCFTAFFYVIVLILWSTFMPGKLKPNLKFYKGGYGHNYSRLREVKTIDSIDILFLGSSHAYRGFDPRIFSKRGYSSFNLGSGAQTPLQTKVLLERYLKKINPKIIIYEVYPNVFQVDGIESSLDIISNDVIDFRVIEMGLKTRNIKVFNSLIYAMFSNAIGLNESFNESIRKEDDRYVQGGFVEKDLAYYSVENHENHIFKPKQDQLNAFESIVSMIRLLDIKLILVYAPIAPVRYNSYQNNNRMDSLFSSYAPYYDFNKILDLDDSLHFYDSHHLNQIGVRKFNNILLDTIDFKALINKSFR